MTTKTIAAAVLLATAALIAGDNHPADEIVFTYSPEITVAEGGSVDFKVNIVLPANHHLYLKHANKNGNAQLVRFSIPPESGFQLKETKRPRGVKYHDEFILRSSGEFHFRLDDLAMLESGTSAAVPLKIRVQLCEEGEVGICYLPVTLEKTINVKIGGFAVLARAPENQTVKWSQSYDAAIAEAKKKNLNIFALISEPSRCGACVQLEGKVLPEPSVTRMLNENFVAYRVPKNERHRAPVKGRYGIPFYYVISASGENLEKWMGAPGAQAFEARIKPYAKTSGAQTAEPVPNPTPTQINLGSCQIELKKSYAYQAMQKGDFRNSGNMRFVANKSVPGAYTVLQLDRSGEIDSSYDARLEDSTLRLEKYLGGRPLPIRCTANGISGSIPEQGLEVNLN